MPVEPRESIGTLHGPEHMLPTVRQVLRAKGESVVTLDRESTVYDALTRMATENIGAVVVLDDARVAGILTERDYARKIALMGRSSKEIPVSEIMTSPVIHVTPDRNVLECMAIMTDRRVRHLLVLEDKRLAGIVSIGDVVKAIIDGQAHMIDQLVGYIHGPANNVTGRAPPRA
jgi:signal-transduction protein with cAMP-binding, CBS, and nucleotidyltransferase domain